MTTKQIVSSPNDLGIILQDFVTFVIKGLLDRSPAGGRRRIYLVILLFLLYWVLIALLENVPPSLFVAELVSTYPEALRGVLFWVGNVVMTFISPLVLRHLVFPLVGLIAALYVGAYYLQDLFELENHRLAFSYLLSAVFGLDQGRITVKDGQVQESDLKNPVYLIGGPGFVTIHLGNAAVFERVNGEISALAQGGGHHLLGFERLRAVVDLRDQHEEASELHLMTREGLPIKVSDLQMRFRIHSNKPRTEADPYPYKDVALRRAVYGQAVNEKGSSNWTAAVKGFISGQVRNYLSRYTLEELLDVESGENVRLKLTEQFYTPQVRKRLEAMGVEIAWVGVGTIESDRITQEQIARWKQEEVQQSLGDERWLAWHKTQANVKLQRGFVYAITSWFDKEQEAGKLTARRLINHYASTLTQWCKSEVPNCDPCTEETKQLIAFLRQYGAPTIIGAFDAPEVAYDGDAAAKQSPQTTNDKKDLEQNEETNK